MCVRVRVCVSSCHCGPIVIVIVNVIVNAVVIATVIVGDVVVGVVVGHVVVGVEHLFNCVLASPYEGLSVHPSDFDSAHF